MTGLNANANIFVPSADEQADTDVKEFVVNLDVHPMPHAMRELTEPSALDVLTLPSVCTECNQYLHPDSSNANVFATRARRITSSIDDAY